jgi:hypothetical protein
MFNLFFLVGFAIFLGVALAILVTRASGNRIDPMVPPEDDLALDPKSEKPLEFEDLYKLARKMCEENELTIKEELVQDTDEVYWVAESQNNFFFGNYVIGFFRASEQTPYVGLTKILEFKDFIRSVGSNKGLFFTTGYFSRDVHQPLEGARVTLYNRLKVLNELKKYQLS